MTTKVTGHQQGSDDAHVQDRLEKAPGWSVSRGGKSRSATLGLLDNCTDANFNTLAPKGVMCVLVTSDATTKAVTSAKPFDQDNFPRHHPAEYNRCAGLAGAPAATDSAKNIAAALASSSLNGEASCSGTACCIKLN